MSYFSAYPASVSSGRQLCQALRCLNAFDVKRPPLPSTIPFVHCQNRSASYIARGMRWHCFPGLLVLATSHEFDVGGKGTRFWYFSCRPREAARMRMNSRPRNPNRKGKNRTPILRLLWFCFLSKRQRDDRCNHRL